jgi:hypothetical protein
MTKPASASLIEQVSESQAQGLTGNGARVTVWNGSGTNIDFTHTGEVIQRVWLDDPSFVTIDFDGNLCGHNSGGCGEGSGASLIHLRRVNGIRFPNLPQTNSTLLTVITDSAVGRKTYLFEVGYGAGAQQYASLVVTPDNQSAVGGGGITVTGGRTADWDDVEQGLHQVIAQKLLAPDSPVVSRVQTFLAGVRNGMTLEQALSSSGVSMAVVSHLAQVGYQSVTPTTLATTPAPVAAPPAPAQSTP